VKLVNVIEFTTKYKFPSLNEWYSAGKWGKRSKDTKLGKDDIKKHLANFVVNFNFDFIKVEYHYHFRRRDCDNTIPSIKYLLDSLTDSGWIKDDSPLFVKQVTLIYNESLPINTQKFVINFYKS